MKRNNTWAAWAIAVAMIGYLVGSATVGHSEPPAPGVSGFATGAAVHVDALQAGIDGPRVVGAALAFSAVNTNSGGFAGASRQNEMQVNLQPELTGVPFAGKNSSARGAALELGLGSDLPVSSFNVLAETFAGQIAPPGGAPVVNDDGIADALAPIAYASLLHSEAHATWTNNPCASTANSPIAFGRGYAVDAQLLDAGDPAADGRFGSPVLATDDPNPERSVVQSYSLTYAIPNGQPNHFGLVAEVHETFAPVSILRGPAQDPLIIEVLGEWVFRTTATGLDGGATLDYSAVKDANGDPVTPTTTVIRISSDGGGSWSNLTFQDVFGEDGLVLPPALLPIIGLAVGENPRAIANPGDLPDADSDPVLAPDGTTASGAVDVVRLSTLAGLQVGTHLEDLRIGHFESGVTVPAGGFVCPPDAPPPTLTPTTTPATLAPTTTPTSLAPTTLAPTTLKPTSTLLPTTTTAAPQQAPPAIPIHVLPAHLTG